MHALVVSLTLIAQVEKPAAPPSAAELAAAAKQLASDEFAEREAASALLWRAGKAARPALEAALKSGDFEAITRAKALLQKLRLGITPSTPPDLVPLLERFPVGTVEEQRLVLQQLRRQDRREALLELIRTLPDDRRRLFFREFAITNSTIVAALLEGGAAQAVRDHLQWNALTADPYSRGPRDYAAYLLLTNQLDKTVAELRATGDKDDKTAVALLARLLQVQGRLDEALTLAKTTDHVPLKADLFYRAEEWAGLAQPDLVPGDRGLERFGFEATFHRLAGHQREFEAAVAGLIEEGKQPDRAWMCSEGLMINGQWAQALALLEQASPRHALRLRCFQLQPAEGLKKLGLEHPRRDAVSWFAARAAKLEATSEEAVREFHLGLAVVQSLHEVGASEPALALLAEVEQYGATDAPWRRHGVLATELKLGLTERAWRRAAVLLAEDKRALAILSELFPQRGAEATHWWHALREIAPEEPPATTLERLKKTLAPEPDATFAALAENAAQRTAALPPQQAAERIRAIAELCALKREHPLAQKYFAQHVELLRKGQSPARDEDPFGQGRPLSPIVSSLQRMGDLHAAGNDWARAAAAYEEAWNERKTNPVPLYLRGHALAKAGQAEEGRKLMDRALLLPLADVEQRRTLAEALQQHGLEREADEQWELILRLGAFEGWEGSASWAVQTAAHRLGDRVAATDPGRAARLWQRMLLYLLKTNTGYTDGESYAQMVSLIHVYKALDLLAKERPDEALREIELARQARPGSTELVEKVFPALVTAGRGPAAEKLLSDVARAYEAVLESFPRSARHHNDLAWLLARCGRRLDDAFTHVTRAVQLEPDSANYRDTLAEVHYRRGARATAIALAKRNLEAEPQNQHFQRQLRRFEEPSPP